MLPLCRQSAVDAGHNKDEAANDEEPDAGPAPERTVDEEGVPGTDAGGTRDKAKPEVKSEGPGDTITTPEPETRGCREGATKPCYTGSAVTRGIGTCRDGTRLCAADGTWGSCIGSVLPGQEACNGRDDDCDGQVDQGLISCVGTITGTGQPGFADGPWDKAKFNSPSGIVVDSKGNLYITDTLNHRIRQVRPDGTVVTFAGTGKEGFADGPRLRAQFARPGAIEIDDKDVLYIADTVNQRIRKVTPEGQVVTIAGSSFGYRDGKGTGARFYFPSGLAIDQQGVLYVGDTLNHAIRKVMPDGTVTTVVGSGKQGYANGLGKQGLMAMPVGVAFALPSFLFVADSANNMIRKVELKSASLTRLAGRGARGYTDGAPDQARFYIPPGVATDAQGQVYVADSANHVIRLISKAGQVSTLVGRGTQGSVDGFGRDALFHGPTDLAFDKRGDLYVVDLNQHNVRKITLR